MKINLSEGEGREKLIELIRKEEHGISITEISEKLELERHTLAKYLDVLYSNGVVEFKQMGMSRLWYATKSPIMKLVNGDDELSRCFRSVLNSFDEGIAIVSPDMRVIWSNDAMKRFSDKSTIIGTECFKAYRQNNKLCNECPATHTLRSGEKHSNIQITIDENGNRDVFELVTTSIKDYNGNIIGFMEKIRKLNENPEVENAN